MREIKFRAWEKKTKQMIPVYNIHFFAKTINVGYPWRFFDEVELMEYTGLKDKNGKEIYEGDILDYTSFWGWYVAFEDGAFRRIPLNETQRINWTHHVLEEKDMGYWKIIGNIHENPDLMEVSECF